MCGVQTYTHVQHTYVVCTTYIILLYTSIELKKNSSKTTNKEAKNNAAVGKGNDYDRLRAFNGTTERIKDGERKE